MILALLLQAGCTGIFAGTLELVGNTMFLGSFPARQVPLAIMVSGAAGILIASTYSYFSKQLRIRSFGVINLVVVVAMTAALIAGGSFLTGVQFSFVVFVLMGPMILITLLSFWITVRGYLSPSWGKQLSGLVELALVTGMVLSSFGIPLLVRNGFLLDHALFAGMGCLIVGTGAQLFVLVRMGKDPQSSSRRTSSTGPIRLFSHKYTGLISAFMVMGVGVSVVLHISFLWTASVQFPGGSERVSFLGLFFGTTVAVAWLMKRILFGWIKRRYGIGLTLLLSPFLLLLFSLATVIVADLQGYASGALALPMVYLMFILSKFVYGAAQGSLEVPSMKMIYQSLDPREKQNVKSGIEGVLSQIGTFTIGLFMACYVLFSFVEIIHVAYVAIALVMVWFFVGLSLVRNYLKMLRISLESDRIRDQTDFGLQDLTIADLNKTAFPIETIEFNPYFFHYTAREKLLSMLVHPHPGVRIRVWDHLLHVSPGLPQLTLSQMLANEREPLIKEKIRSLTHRKLRNKLGLQAAFIKERLDRFSAEVAESDPAISEAFHSGESNEIFAALYHVARERDPTFLTEVVTLIKGKDIDLSSVAICTAGQLDSRRLTTNLIECLEHPVLYASGWSALVHQGEAVLEELEAAFHRPASGVNLQQRILSVISAIGGPRAMQLLVEKLDYHQREVFTVAVLGLYENHFQASSLQEAAVQAAMLRLVKTGAWNLAAKVSIRLDNPGGYLEQAIDHEIWEDNHMIMMLLALIYDRRSVRRIRMNLLDKQAEDRGMAIELLELLLDEPLKTVLVSYYTDVLVREKIDKLHSLFRIDLIPVDPLLRKILNRDGMQMGDFIRICVLERMGNSTHYFDEQQIIAQGFHPNPRIRETAAQLLRKNDPGRYDLVTERLDFPVHSIPDQGNLAGWYVETTMNLAAWKLFKNVGINSLFKLVSALQPYSTEQTHQGDFVLLARSEAAADFSPLSSGIAIIAVQQPEILEQIRYLGTDRAHDAYLIEREKFIELLFDDRSLLHVFCAFLNQTVSGLV
jgi:hypothetical protein